MLSVCCRVSTEPGEVALGSTRSCMRASHASCRVQGVAFSTAPVSPHPQPDSLGLLDGVHDCLPLLQDCLPQPGDITQPRLQFRLPKSGGRHSRPKEYFIYLHRPLQDSRSHPNAPGDESSDGNNKAYRRSPLSPDGEGAKGASGTKARELARTGQEVDFVNFVAPGEDENMKKELYRQVRKGLGIE